MFRARLLGEISKQLGAVVNDAVAVSIQGEPCVAGILRRPRELFFPAVAIDVEEHAVVCIRQFKAVAAYVNQDWRVVPVLAATGAGIVCCRTGAVEPGFRGRIAIRTYVTTGTGIGRSERGWEYENRNGREKKRDTQRAS